MNELSVKYFIIPFVFFLIAVVAIFLISGHGEFLLWLNSQRNPFLDVVFRGLTFMGDWGGVIVAFLILIVIKNWRAGIVLFAGVAAQIIVTAFLKRVVFSNTPRPKVYFNEIQGLDFIEGVKVHAKFSFPSGHTMAAFVVATILSVAVRDKRWSLVFLLSAILTGISRIYLLQHFLIDVIGGSCIGALIGATTAWTFKKFVERCEN